MPFQAFSQSETVYPDNLIALSSDPHFSSYAFVVDKSARLLKVYKITGEVITLVEEHPTDIGKMTGDKEKANDHKTPVGIYFLMERKTQPEIPFSEYGSLAFTTDYPNIFDKRIAKGGSGIWLHAVPDSVPLTRGSRGCVVVRNDVIQRLAGFIQLGQTPLLIAEKITYLNQKDYLSQKNKYLEQFEKWRTAWEKNDVDTYIQFYDPTFKNNEMNYRQWYRHKKKLKDLYKYIKVSLFPPVVLRNRNQVVIRTAQRYESDLHQDFGEKTIHASFADDTGFKIIREDWKGFETIQTQTRSLSEVPKESQAAKN
jgi:murein L,D-transpeptidase YafK